MSRLETQKTKNGSERSLSPPPEDNLNRETWKETTFMETRDDDTEHQNLVVDVKLEKELFLQMGRTCSNFGVVTQMKV